MSLRDEFSRAVVASRSLAQLSEEEIDNILVRLSEVTINRIDEILVANAKDLENFDRENPLYDRLLLNEERVKGIAADILNVASLKSSVGEVLSSVVRPNGMRIDKVRVPFGVIGVIYEARPNVSFDVFALCFKSSNACVLKGGSDAAYSNEVIVNIIRSVLTEFNVDPSAVTLLPATREATAELLDAVGYVDLIIPRGGKSLINYVRDNSRVPVIETGAGVCHTYVDKYADLDKATSIINNAKTRRVSVCNALDTIVIHRDRLGDLASICEPLAAKSVIIYADDDSFEALMGGYPDNLLERADASCFGVEFLDYKLSIRCVDSFDAAVDYVSRSTSHHSESIITENKERGELYCKLIDAACLYINVSTAFTDGAQFGFGAEIGISTQKMHARGPMALDELTVYKYIIRGDGQVR
ncbi:MAG: glutamate-5-semialdehyde dehydrogenase [Rikenellaceae bacterium]